MHTFRQTRSYLYVTHRHNFKIQNALVSKRRTLFTWKVGNRYKWSTYYAYGVPNEDFDDVTCTQRYRDTFLSVT